MAARNPLDSLLGRFVERANGGRLSDGAVVLPAADLGFDPVPIGVVEGAPSVPGDLVSLLVPGGTSDEKVEREGVKGSMALVPGEAFGDAAIAPARRGGGDGEPAFDRVVDLTALLPEGSWTPGRSEDASGPGEGWLTPSAAAAGIEISVEKVERAGLAPVATGSGGWEGAFGSARAGASPPGRPVRGDETFEPGRTLLAVTGDALLETWPDDVPMPPATDRLELGDAVPVPAPLGGVTFGVAVLSTPSVSVAGRSANPLVEVGTSELLRSEAARDLLVRAGITDAETISWRDGPERVDLDDPSTATVLGTEAPFESFVGVVDGEAGPWGVGVHVVRADADDHVIVAGVHRRAVGSGGAIMAALREGRDLREARRLLAETAARLQVE